MVMLTKRSFFVGSISVAATLLCCARHRDVSYRAINDVGSFLKLLGTYELSAQALGREYLRLVPIEADPTVLIALVRDSSLLSLESNPLAVREWAKAKVRRDFAAGRLITIQGWVMSVTEARLCALMTLVASRS